MTAEPSPPRRRVPLGLRITIAVALVFALGIASLFWLLRPPSQVLDFPPGWTPEGKAFAAEWHPAPAVEPPWFTEEWTPWGEGFAMLEVGESYPPPLRIAVTQPDGTIERSGDFGPSSNFSTLALEGSQLLLMASDRDTAPSLRVLRFVPPSLEPTDSFTMPLDPSMLITNWHMIDCSTVFPWHESLGIVLTSKTFESVPNTSQSAFVALDLETRAWTHQVVLNGGQRLAITKSLKAVEDRLIAPVQLKAPAEEFDLLTGQLIPPPASPPLDLLKQMRAPVSGAPFGYDTFNSPSARTTDPTVVLWEESGWVRSRSPFDQKPVPLPQLIRAQAEERLDQDLPIWYGKRSVQTVQHPSLKVLPHSFSDIEGVLHQRIQLSLEDPSLLFEIDDQHVLLVQRMVLTPQHVNEGRGALRLAKIDVATGDFTWLGWVPLPPLTHTASLPAYQSFMPVSYGVLDVRLYAPPAGDRLVIAIANERIDSSPKPGVTDHYWTSIPIPAGLSPEPGRMLLPGVEMLGTG